MADKLSYAGRKEYMSFVNAMQQKDSEARPIRLFDKRFEKYKRYNTREQWEEFINSQHPSNHAELKKILNDLTSVKSIKMLHNYERMYRCGKIFHLMDKFDRFPTCNWLEFSIKI